MGGEGDGGGSEGYYTRAVRALPCRLHHIAQLLTPTPGNILYMLIFTISDTQDV